MEEEKKEIMNLLKSSEFKQWVEATSSFRIAKSTGISEVVRKKGNDMFNSGFHDAQVHEEIWKTYSLSIALAENDTEGLAVAYGNRSAILLHMSKYTACMNDIDRALNITKNKSFSIKLLLRKVKCLHALGLEECKSIFKEAELLWSEITEPNLKMSFNKDIDKIKLLLTKPFKHKSDSKDKKSEMLDELVHQYRINDFSSVKVHYNNKFGRHLIATKDFRPGDVIYIEKPFVQIPNVPKSHAFCSYCFATTWANIPCDHCALTMFCSRECKKEAWIKYHHIECSLYGNISNAKKGVNDKSKQLAVRLLIMALKEFGSVEKLKLELMNFDKCSDRKKGFIVDEKIETDGFKTVYTLSRNVSNESLKKHETYTKMVLTSLAKNTNYFGEYFIANNVNSYKMNENAVFLGSLFLRLSKISQINGRQMWNPTYDCPNRLERMRCWENECCSPGVYIAPVSSLLNHSCNANVSRCYTSDKTIILYATQPIKKASQIFDSYILSYHTDNLVKRQKLLSNIYNFNCDCPACKQHWPSRLNSLESLPNLQLSSVDFQLAMEFKDLMIKYAYDVKTNYDEKTIAHLRDGIEKGLKSSSRPSSITADLIDGLQVIFNQIYGISLEVQRKCHNI